MVRKIPNYFMKGFYPAGLSDLKDINTLVCVVGERKVVTIKKVMLEKGAPDWARAFEGMKDVPVMFMHRSYEDRVYFGASVDRYITLSMFRDGTLFDFGYAQRKKETAGMIAVDKAIAEAMATETPPEPKPEDEPKNPAKEPNEREQPKEPEPAPQPHHPTAARRRRRKVAA